MQVQSKACCSRPPVTLAGGYDYEPKGKYVSYNGLKTCKKSPTLALHFTRFGGRFSSPFADQSKHRDL